MGIKYFLKSTKDAIFFILRSYFVPDYFLHIRMTSFFGLILNIKYVDNKKVNIYTISVKNALNC